MVVLDNSGTARRGGLISTLQAGISRPLLLMYSRSGTKFESHIYRKMGEVEVRDQVDGLLHLICKSKSVFLTDRRSTRNTPDSDRKCLTCVASADIVDPCRIMVTGTSYGGYLSLMCLAKRPDIYRVRV